MWPFSTLIRDSAAAGGAEERSSIDFSAFSDYWSTVNAGVSVTQTSAVNLPAVYKCVNLNAETISSLPLDVLVRRGDQRMPYQEPVWFRQPNPFQTMRELVAMTQTSLDLAGNAYWMKAVDDVGRLAGLSVLPPSAVQIEVRDGRLIYWVQTNAGREPMAPTEIVHLRGMVLPGEYVGLSPIDCAKQTIGIGLAAEQFGGQFFGSGATLSGVITSPGTMTQEQAERLKEAFTKKHGGISRSHAIGVLSGGAAWTPLSVKPDEAQFLESRRYSAAEIANLFGVPVEFVGDGVKDSAGYVTGVAMRFRMWYLTGLLPRIVRIEEAMSNLLPRPAFVKFNTNGLLRMDPEQRIAFYQAAQLGEWLTRNEIRSLEDMNPVEDGDEFLHSVQWADNAPEPEEEEDEPPEPADDTEVEQ